VLRHSAPNEGLQLRPDGYVLLAALLATRTFQGVTREQVENVVAADAKQRFAIFTDPPTGSLLIRANQGHSIALGIDDDEAMLERLSAPPAGPAVAVHGTRRSALEAIIASGGLSPMSRRHVHLATGLPSARTPVVSGMRASADVHIWIDLASAHAAGLPFFRAANGVILTPGVRLPSADRSVRPAVSVGTAEAVATATDGDARLLALEHFASVVDARTGEPIAGPWDATN
jgi:2'-phosphotransferase